MNRLRKILPGSLISAFGISVFAISVFVLFASTSNAVTFPAFDHMDSYAQAEFVADMVDRTEKALRDDGKPDLALKTEQLFAHVEPGDKMSVGLAELEMKVARARVADLDRLKKDPKAQRVGVEDALFIILKKNGIELSGNEMNSVMSAMANFHRITEAEFRALPPSEQRHIVRLFAEIALPDYLIKDALAEKKSTLFGLDDKASANLAEIMSTQFPASGEQPGFAHVASDVEKDSVKYANVPVFYTVVLYFQKELRKGVAADIQKDMARSVLLPDGRHAYPSDDFTTFEVCTDPKDGAGVDESTCHMLEPNLRHLALLLVRCIQTSGITDGRRAQTVCLERVTGVHPPAQAAPPPPPPAAPSSPPASSTDNHPFGSGGFITPPTNFKVMLCVSADVANNSLWNQPVAGSKMAAFKDLVARYIVSVAKPGWEYWIAQGRYERFDPATTTSGDQIVSTVSPNSGRFDEFHPKCPSGYGAFWVQVNH